MRKIRELFGGFGNAMFQYAYLYAQFKRGEIPDMYIQDFKYFDDYVDEIRGLYSGGIKNCFDFVSLHIRRGDYVGNPFYVDLSKTDYYKKAIAMFPNDKFLIFCADRQAKSDDKSDREWCKEYLVSIGLPLERFTIFQGTEDEAGDMNMMASCRDNIIANSTFSLWAGWLNPNPNKKVIAPSVKNWYADGQERTICPPEFIRI